MLVYGEFPHVFRLMIFAKSAKFFQGLIIIWNVSIKIGDLFSLFIQVFRNMLIVDISAIILIFLLEKPQIFLKF